MTGPLRPTTLRLTLGLVALCAALALGRAPLSARTSVAAEGETIAFGSRTVELTVDGSPGHVEWEQRVTGLVAAAGAVLEELIGVPYPGPDSMAVSERSDEQLDGYAGTAGCSHVTCHIRLSSTFDNTTLLHELTHAWTQSFRNRWLAEGVAEFISDRASARIDGRPLPAVEPAGDSPPFALLDWTISVDLETAEEELMVREYEGYYWSNRFFQQLEATVGADALKRTIVAVVPLPDGSVGVRRFMDALDDAGGVQADDLFIRYIFPPGRASEVTGRRAARDRLSALTVRVAAEAPELSQDVLAPVQAHVAAWEFPQALTAIDHLESGLTAYLSLRDRLSALRTAAETAGLAYPHPLQNALQTWDFAPFLDRIDEAESAIVTYSTAKERLAAPRGLWQRIGLFGQRPENGLDSAAQAFAAANFNQSIDRSHDAEASLEAAGDRAVTNLLIVGGLLASIVIGGFAIWRWGLRTDPTPTQA